MEFIPLETHSNKKMKKAVKKTSPGKGQSDTETFEFKTNKDVKIKKKKEKLQSKMIEKKKVKNKYREMIAKKGKRIAAKVSVKKRNEDENDDVHDDGDDDDEVKEEEESSEESQETVEMDEEGGNEDDEGEEEEDEEAVIEKKREASIKEKWKKMDEKMKNRLFVKMKKKIVNEAQVKELHPDIRGVIFPRKKNSRWCWAVFSSQEKAVAALKKLSKNREILVTLPNPRERVERKREEKLRSVQRRKENRRKIEKMWT